MRIIIAPDKFKGTLSASQVCDAIADGIREVDPAIDLDLCPLSDGGEGFVDAMVRATNGTFHTARVTGPLPEMKLDATYGMLGATASDGIQTAVIEMAAASGLALLKPQDYDPEATTTFGTGELIVDAIRHGARHILLGIGGSATIDAGIGCAHASGLTVLMRDGEPTSLSEPLCGRDIERVLYVKHGRGSVVDAVKFTVACDVLNPLCGEQGAARIYGPQKGATPEQVEYFDRVLRELAARSTRPEIADAAGAGAAGGLGFGMMAFFGAQMQSGADLVIRHAVGSRISQADLVLTGEGRFDHSSAFGKLPARLASLAEDANKPCIVLCGDREPSLIACGKARVIAITDHVSPDLARSDAAKQLRQLTVKRFPSILDLIRTFT